MCKRAAGVIARRVVEVGADGRIDDGSWWDGRGGLHVG